MKIKVDEEVLKKTAIFRKVLENLAVRAGKCPALSVALEGEFKSERESAIDYFRDVGVCIRAEKIDFKCTCKCASSDCVGFVGESLCLHLDRKGYCNAKVVDIVTGGKENDIEYAVLVECKFNVNPPPDDRILYCFSSWENFMHDIAEKFLVKELWDIYGLPVFFVLFNEEVAPLAARHFDRLRLRESDDEGRSDCIRRFTVCDLTEFREYFV